MDQKRVSQDIPDTPVFGSRQNIQSPILAAVIFSAACAWTLKKSLVPEHYSDEFYFWLVTYQHGFVRRGLVGTLLSPLMHGRSPATVQQLLIMLHAVMVVGTFVSSYAVVSRLISKMNIERALLISVTFALSPFLGQLIHHIGYPDGLIAILVLATCMRLPRAGPIEAALLLITCSLVHELCFVILLPMVAFSFALRRDLRWHGLAVLISACSVVALIILTAPVPGANLQLALVQAGSTPIWARDQIAMFYGRSLSDWLPIMWREWTNNTFNGCAGVAYAGLPAVCILWFAWPNARESIAQRSPRRCVKRCLALLYVASGLTCITVLAIALDVSRIASFTTLAALGTTALLPDSAAVRKQSRSVLGVGGLALVFYAFVPLFDLHFGAGRVVNLALSRTVCPPCAIAARAGLVIYNRSQPTQFTREVLSEPGLNN